MAMKILSLTVKGFRSLKNVVNWQPGDLNVLIGPNGSGKSNLLRVLELLAISAQGGLGKLVQSCGGMEPLLWDGFAEAIHLNVRCSPMEFNELRSLNYDLNIAPLGKTGEYRIASETLLSFSRLGQKTGPPFRHLKREGLHVTTFEGRIRSKAALEENIPPLETLLSLTADPFHKNRLLPHFRSQMSNWSVYHDLQTDQDSAIRLPAVTRHEKRVQPDGQNLIPVLHTLYTGDRDFKKEIDAAMQAAFGSDFEELVFAPASDRRIQLRVRWKSLRREQSATDLSDGTLRFLFLLSVLSSPDPAPLIAIDEPESGLHPSMLPIVAEYAVDASRRTQVVLTTHSPQFLDAFDKTIPTTTLVKWNDGQTELKTIDGTELKRWLNDYSLGALHQSGELEAMAK